MKNLVRLLFISFVLVNITFAQTAHIKTEAVTPHSLSSLGLTTNSVSSGLDVVPNQTYVYLSAWNIGNDEPISSATFTLISQPATSTASLETVNPTWVQFKPDVIGTYTVQLSITTTSGTDETTVNIYSSSFVGVGNFAGTSAEFPQCMACHSTDQKFAEIFDRWEVSGHANVFNRELEISDHYSTSCMKCHTTGYDHNLVADNNGFDDIATSLGWSYIAPGNDMKWDSLVTYYPTLVNHATIGCESCHGPGREHAYGGHVEKIAISLEAGVCAQCHDEPWRHNKYSEFENSAHSEAVWETTTGSNGNTNNLGDCIRCHDGLGFANFTKGLTTNTTGWTEELNATRVTCASCHDPHGNSNEYSLRQTPAGSDTLANGYQYTLGGDGQLCMNCHKSRSSNVRIMSTAVSQRWGPHHSVQADILLGQNAAEFETPFISGYHRFALVNSCVDCHMVATTDVGTDNRDKVGGHSFNLHNDETDYDHTTSCVPCHGERENFEAFEATFDYDDDGTLESVRHEIAGLEQKLRIFLPPYGEDAISWQMIRDNNDPNEKKAYWNYQLISNDGSGGMHNPRFAIDVLTKSIIAIHGSIPVQLVAFDAQLTSNNVKLSWETATETNNLGFEIEKKNGQSWRKIGFIEGKGTTTILNNYSFTDKLDEYQSGKIYYRLKQIDFDGTSSYSKEVFIENDNTPREYELSQNYPNPFNPNTTIKYSLPFDSNVKIIVYNITGEKVKELVNSVIGVGSYTVDFNTNGADLSSGIYFYTIEANAVDKSGSFRETKKMILLK